MVLRIDPIGPPESTRAFAFTCDDAYVRYLSVVLLSLAAHAEPGLRYDIVVIHDGITPQSMQTLEEILPEGFSLRFCDVGDYARELLGDLTLKISSQQWSIATFYGLLVPFIMPDYERVLVCDADIVFGASPEELFRMPFDGAELIAVRDTLAISAVVNRDNAFIARQLEFVRNSLGIEDLETYFNGGVLLFNVPAIDPDDYMARVREGLSFPELPAVDQEVLNHVFHDRVKIAPQRFNTQVGALEMILRAQSSSAAGMDLVRAAQDPVIIHYTTHRKPWSSEGVTMAEVFWEYAALSPWHSDIWDTYLREPLAQSLALLSIPRMAAHYVLSHVPGKGRERFRRGFEGHLHLYRFARSRGGITRPEALYRRIGRPLAKASLALGDLLPAWPPRLSRRPRGTGEAECGVLVSHDSGFYRADQIDVELSVPEGCTLALTMDGSLPTAEHDTGQQWLRITLEALGRTTQGYLAGHGDLMTVPGVEESVFLDDEGLPSGRVLRVAMVDAAGNVGPALTRVFFLGTNPSTRFPKCLVASVVADPDDLVGYERGILATGALYDAWRATSEAQRSVDEGATWLFQGNHTQTGPLWERPCLLQIFDGAPTPAAEAPAGLRLCGKSSRMEGQRSFALFLRKEYGAESLGIPLFEGTPDTSAFRLRSGGNNARFLKFKDALLQEMVAGRHVVTVQTRPAVLFLNGEYWGAYLLGEWISARMLHDRLGVAEDQVVLAIEGAIAEGAPEDLSLYEELMSFAERDLAQPEAWEEFCRTMDVQSFADHCAIRIYTGVADWAPDENDVLWRTRDDSYDGGRWQCVLFDLEYSSGLYAKDPTSPTTDHFARALHAYPLFAAAMRNREFRRLFLDSLERIGSEDFEPKRVEKALRRHMRVWAPLLADCYRRYGDTHHLWSADLAATLDFFARRFDVIVPLVRAWCAVQDAQEPC